MKIGYCGLGNMGTALAERLLIFRELMVYDLAEAARARLVSAGASTVSDNSTLGRECDIVFLCLPTSSHVREAIFGEDGLAATMKPGSMIVDQTSGDPAETVRLAGELAEQGIELIDAPVSGGPAAAAEGRIVVMVGASPAQFERVAPLLREVTDALFHVGAAGAGQTLKIANNLITASQRLLTLEALALAARNGVDSKVAVDVIARSSGRNYTIEHTLPVHILTGRLFQGCSLETMHKDLQLALKLGRDSEVPLAFAGLAAEIYQSMMIEHGRKTEVNAMALTYQHMARTRICPDDWSLEP